MPSESWVPEKGRGAESQQVWMLLAVMTRIAAVTCVEERLRQRKNRHERKLRESRNLAPWRKGKADILKLQVGRERICKSSEHKGSVKCIRWIKHSGKILILAFLFQLDRLQVASFTLRERCEKAFWDLSTMTRKEPCLWLIHGTESK